MVLKLNEIQAKLDSQVNMVTAESTQDMLNRECEIEQDQASVLPVIALLTAKMAFLSDQQSHVEEHHLDLDTYLETIVQIIFQQCVDNTGSQWHLRVQDYCTT